MNKQLNIFMSCFLLLITNTTLGGQNTDTGEGRYQIYFSPHARADTYLVDSKTGKVWSQVQYTDVVGQPKVWKYQDRIDSEKNFLLWLNNQKFIEKGQ